jgi:hypothetical protein
LKRATALALACTILFSVTATSQTRRRTTVRKPTTPKTSFEEKQQAEIKSGRQLIATQIKTLTQFLYLFGNISKGIETAEQLNKNHEQTTVGMAPDRIEQSKSRLKDSIKNVRAGLDQLESSFKLNSVLQTYYPNIAGVGKLGQTAESQAAANSFDQSGRSLLAAVNKLTDALVSVR